MAISGGHQVQAASLSTEMAADAPPPPDVKPSRLILVLASWGAAWGLVLAGAFKWTQPRIEKYRNQETEEAVREVLKGPARISALYVNGGSFSETLPAGADPTKADRVYVGYDRGGQRIGFAIPATGPGFQNDLGLIFGYDPATGELIGMKVIEAHETPGIGDKVQKDSAFVHEFSGPKAPIEGVKPGRGTGNDHAIDMITGATISSRAVVAIINKRVEALRAALESYEQQGGAR